MSVEPAPSGRDRHRLRAASATTTRPCAASGRSARPARSSSRVTVLYLPWMFASLNRGEPWLAWPFLVANVLTIFTALLAVFNAWWRTAPPRRPLPRGAEPHVGLIVPTCGEAPAMILRTVLSVLVQDWPEDKLTVVVSDDKGDPALREALADWPVLYHRPVPRDAPGRDGAAKAGNLNDALAMLDRDFPDLRLHRDPRRRRRDGLDPLPARDRGPARGRRRPRLRADDQGVPGQRRRPVQQPRVALLPRPDARPQRRQRGLPLRLRRRLAAHRPALDRRLPGLEPGRGPPVRLRGAEARLARHVPADRRRGRPALARRRPQRLQAARHLGDRHRAPAALQPLARPRPPPARPVPRTPPLLHQRLHRARLRAGGRSLPPRHRAAGSPATSATSSTCCR